VCQFRAAARGGLTGLDIFRQDLESVSKQRVTGQNRDGLAKYGMTTGPPTTHVVVVHRREIIMNQRVSMYHFDGHCRGHRFAAPTTASLGGH
jgi:hypothetical protein